MRFLGTRRRIRRQSERQGSTLVVVIALLSLLSFIGMIFFTFASQERAAAEYFSEAAKAPDYEPVGVWPHMLEQVLVGPSEQHQTSILYSPSRRHSLARNLLGSDIYPHNGESLEVEYDSLTGNPQLSNWQATDLLDFVDSPAARRTFAVRNSPEPDIDYTYPDINNLFLAYKGWAIRQDADGRRTQVPVIIPSFFRPQYMRQAASAAAGALSTGFHRSFGPVSASVLTNPHWAYAYDPPRRRGELPSPVDPSSTSRDSVLFSARSFRPHPSHIAGVGPNGVPVRRYLTDDEAAELNIAAGGFPFLPEERGAGRPGNGNEIQGDLGIWTGSPDLAYELDADNDGDGITEGIWLDLNFPVQEFHAEDGSLRTYAVLHSVTIYDLDGLINLNVHGNLAGMPRSGMDAAGNRFPYTLPQASADGFLSANFLSRSHHGLGPHEVNPLWALRRDDAGIGPFDRSLSDKSLSHMFQHFGGWPVNSLQQANMEWTWLLTGRGDYSHYAVNRDPLTQAITDVTISDLQDVLSGRWGDEQLLFNALERRSPRMQVADLPRPGRAGNCYSPVSSGVSFGGRDGFDDNLDSLEGSGLQSGETMLQRPFGHPMSFSGMGRRTSVDFPVYDPGRRQFVFSTSRDFFGTDNPLVPILLSEPDSSGPLQFPGYLCYGACSDAVPASRYTNGVDEFFTGTNQQFDGTGGDDLNHIPVYDELFEDPLETIFDPDQADHQNDSIASIGDLIGLQWPSSGRAAIQLRDARDKLSTRLNELAPHALDLSSDNREMFTTFSNSLRYFPLRRSAGRPWEFSADTDGIDTDGDGFADGDGLPEFPPAFGATPSTGLPYSRTDPFRAPVRRLLTNEAGEARTLIGSLPLSINHILDVQRTAPVPPDGTPEYLRYLQQAGLGFRSLTEHPIASDSSAAGRSVLACNIVPTLELHADGDPNTFASAAQIPFPPDNPADQEFWARRDRQQLARDIYVLLYTLGGAEQVPNGIRDYTASNDPDAPPGTALYSHDQLRRMAQFAVNLVDAMDTDAVITKFEYDKNLGNGWNLDDDPFSAETAPLPEGTPGSEARQQFDNTTALGRYREDSDSRGVVFGVEAQHVAVNEVLALRCGQTQIQDHRATLHDDLHANRDHLFVELQNLLPQSLQLATSRSLTPDTGIYRIARLDRTQKHGPLNSVPVAAVTFLSNAGSIRGGGQFTIAGASDNAVVSSDLFINTDLNDTFELIAPNVESILLPTTSTNVSSPSAPELKPRTDLDLIHPDHANGRFAVTGPASFPMTTPGAFLDQLQVYKGNMAMRELSADAPAAGGDFVEEGARLGFDLVLQRRLNPNMPSLTSSTGQHVDVNPWVEVDRVPAEFIPLNLQDTDSSSELTGEGGRLAMIRSFERKEPLDDSTRRQFPLPQVLSSYRFNSIGSAHNTACLRDPKKPRNENSSSLDYNPLEYSGVWQPHFDRDFASPAELLNLPLFGPDLLTQRLRFSQLGPQQQTLLKASFHQVSGASAMLLRPEFDPESSGMTHLNNRWYRLLQFVEVPSRVNRMLGSYLNRKRLPGKINLNMIRHQEVFAGLIDDPMFADTDGNRLASPFLTSQTPGTNGRDHWTEFMHERDGLIVEGYCDPTPEAPASGDEATQFLIPGTPGSRPFRSYGYTRSDSDDNGIEHTILRRLMADRDEDFDGDDDELQPGLPSDDDDGNLIPDDDKLSNNVITNRHWLEPGFSAGHTGPAKVTTPVERHQILSKIMNNTTTVSNTFVVFATAACFEAWRDPASGFYRIGGRIDLTGNDDANPGWQQRAVFVIDRTEAFNAYDPTTGSFD